MNATSNKGCINEFLKGLCRRATPRRRRSWLRRRCRRPLRRLRHRRRRHRRRRQSLFLKSFEKGVGPLAPIYLTTSNIFQFKDSFAARFRFKTLEASAVFRFELR